MYRCTLLDPADNIYTNNNVYANNDDVYDYDR